MASQWGNNSLAAGASAGVVLRAAQRAVLFAGVAGDAVDAFIYR